MKNKLGVEERECKKDETESERLERGTKRKKGKRRKQEDEDYVDLRES